MVVIKSTLSFAIDGLIMNEWVTKFLRMGLGILLILTMISARAVHVNDIYDSHDSHEHCSDQTISDSFDGRMETAETPVNEVPSHEPTASHCHGAQCVFMLVTAMQTEFSPLALDMFKNYGKILSFSYGVLLEDIDPPRILRL